MPDQKKPLSPEDIFAQALRENNNTFSPKDMKLLLSGLSALREHHQKTINKIELQSITALVAYVAYTQNIDQETVRTVVTSHFDVKEVKDLPHHRYHDIVEHLVDLEMDRIVN